MRRRKLVFGLILTTIALLLTATARPMDTVRADISCSYPVHDAFIATLQPGDWEGVVLSNCEADKAYLVEMTPLAPSISGAHIQRYVVQPEYNGHEWNDVLRMVIPEDHPAMDVHVRIYDVSSLPVVESFNTELQPGVWHGWDLGETTQDRGYVVEITPLEPSIDGAHVERYVVQPEYDGIGWYDVLRIMLAPEDPPLHVHVRVRAVADWPIVLTQTVTAQPGISNGIVLGPAVQDRAMVAEISPVITATPPTAGPNVEWYVIQPEYDGAQWNDVFRFITRPEDPVTQYTVRAWLMPGVETSAAYMPICARPPAE